MFRSVSRYTDSPFRRLRADKALKLERKHYQKVLLFGDPAKLVSTAESLIRQPDQPVTPAFWKIFGQRVTDSLHLLNAIDLSLIAKAFETQDNRQFFVMVAEFCATTKIENPGALLLLTEVLASKLSPPDRQDLMGLLINQLCLSCEALIYELHEEDLLDFLDHLARLCQLGPPNMIQVHFLLHKLGRGFLKINQSPEFYQKFQELSARFEFFDAHLFGRLADKELGTHMVANR